VALLLAVDFANHRHPFFDLSQLRRSEAPACIELCAEPSVGLTVLTILSVTILSDMGTWFRLAFDKRPGVSPTSLTDSCVFSDFLAINLNGVLAATAANASGAASADTAHPHRRGSRALPGN